MTKTHIVRKEVPVCGPAEALAHEVAEVPEADNQEVTEVRREEDVVRRVLLGVAAVRRASLVLAGIAKVLVRAVPKLGVHGGEHLLRGRRDLGVREPVDVVEVGLVEDGFA